MKLFHIVLNVTNADWTKKGELKRFFEIAQSKSEVKEKFNNFENAVIVYIREYFLFFEPVTVKFSMTACNVDGKLILCESQPIKIKNTLELIEKIEDYGSHDYLTLDWRII